MRKIHSAKYPQEGDSIREAGAMVLRSIPHPWAAASQPGLPHPAVKKKKMHQGTPGSPSVPLCLTLPLSAAPSWKASARVLSRSLFQWLRAFGVQALTDCRLIFKAERREGGARLGERNLPFSYLNGFCSHTWVKNSEICLHSPSLIPLFSFCIVLESCPLPALTAKPCHSLSPAVGTGLVRKTHTCLPLRLQWGR